MDEKIFEKYLDKDHCPVRCILSRIGDKWFNELHREVPDISQKMLTATLRSLEADGLVSRRIYPVIPPKVEYELTDLGKSLLPHLQDLSGWAHENMDQIMKHRKGYETANSK